MARGHERSSGLAPRLPLFACVVFLAVACSSAHAQRQQEQHQRDFNAAVESLAQDHAHQSLHEDEPANVWAWLVDPRKGGDAAEDDAGAGAGRSHGVIAEGQGPLEAAMEHLKRTRLGAAIRDFQAAQRLGGLDGEQEAMLAQTEAMLRRLGGLASDDANEHALDATQLKANHGGLMAALMDEAHASGQLEDAPHGFHPNLGGAAHAQQQQQQQVDAATQTTFADSEEAEEAHRTTTTTTQFDTFTTEMQQGDAAEEGVLLADMGTQTDAAATPASDDQQSVNAAYLSEYEEAASAALAAAGASASAGLEVAAKQQHQQQQQQPRVSLDVVARLREAQERLAGLPWTLLGAQRLEDARDPMATTTGQQQQQQQVYHDTDADGASSSVASQLDPDEAQALSRDLDNMMDAQDQQDEAAQAATALPDLAAHLLRGMMLRHQQQQQQATVLLSAAASQEDAYEEEQMPLLPHSSSTSSSSSYQGSSEADSANEDYEQEAAAVRDALLLGPFAFVRRFVESVMDRAPVGALLHLGRGRPATTSRVLVLPGQLVLVHSRHYEEEEDNTEVQHMHSTSTHNNMEHDMLLATEEQQQEGARQLPSDDNGGALAPSMEHDWAEGAEGQQQRGGSGGGAWVQPRLWGASHTWHGLMPHPAEQQQQQEQQEADKGQDLASLYLSLFQGMRRAGEAARGEEVLLQHYLAQQQQQVAHGDAEGANSDLIILPSQPQGDQAEQQQQQHDEEEEERTLPRVPHEWAGLLEADGHINLGALLLAGLLMATLFMLVGFVRSLDSLQGAMAACSTVSSRGVGGLLEGEVNPLLVPFVVEGSDGVLQQGYLLLSEEELRQAAAAAGYQPPVGARGAAAAGGDDLGKDAAQAAWGAKRADKQQDEVVVVVPGQARAEEQEERRREGGDGVVFARNFV